MLVAMMFRGATGVARQDEDVHAWAFVSCVASIFLRFSKMELRETQAPPLPAASVPELWRLRKEACEQTQSFRLQSHQRYLRRVLSPDSPLRNLLMVHGTGVGKTCTAIQVAEEYILRPEFQDKKVLILANPSVQENFRREIFDVGRVKEDHGVLRSSQCTGRRYLDMLERMESEPARWNDPEVRERLRRVASDIIREFYEFQGYREMANQVLAAEQAGKMEEWIHKTFDHRLIIVDEAHNLRRQEEGETISNDAKRVSQALEYISKVADHCVLVFLTATPIYDTYAEILFYFNLFLWNDRRQRTDTQLDLDTYFTDQGDLRTEKSEEFRGWVQDYVSFVKGESPFTFPFRLPPPDTMIAPADKTKSPSGKKVVQRRKFLPLVGSVAQGAQLEALRKGTDAASVQNRLATLAVPPAPFTLNESKQYEYNGEAWLAPSKLPQYAAKFATVIQSILKGKGVCLVYSNFVEGGALLFSMALEEAGFAPIQGISPLLANPAQEGGLRPGASGRYALLTEDAAEQRRILQRVRQTDNKNGELCRVIVTSPRVSEGVDFRFVRQVHVLDPWFNMSRLEQVVGRGMRTCSHALLPELEQNCTVYFHICRMPENRECLDEFLYRTKVEPKATQIAKVRRVLMESAMDCSLQLQVNALPDAWLRLDVEQTRSQDSETKARKLGEMMAPIFEEATPLRCQIKDRPDDGHPRPLSTYLDVRDEILDELQKRFHQKPIWTGDELRQSLNRYQPDVVTFLLQDAVRSGVAFTDPNDRPSILQSRGVFYALAPRDGTGHETLVQRLIDKKKPKIVELSEAPLETAEPPSEGEPPAGIPDVAALSAAYDWKPEWVERYSVAAREAYYFDVLMPAAQRKQVLLGPSSPWNAPIEQRLDGDRVLRILGPGELYINSDKLTEEPTGEVLDALETWLRIQYDRFADLKEKLCATYVGGLKIWTYHLEDGTPIRERKVKSVTPTAASSIKLPLLEGLAAYLQPPGFPETLKNKDQRIQELHLMIRQAGPERIAWWTPEAWAMLETKTRPLLARVARK